ncbi:MAG: hypothetical protein C4325_12715 [Blastocatellia bacterium]
MQVAERIFGPADEIEKVREMQLGANWFFWMSILAIADILLSFFAGWAGTLIGLGTTRYIDNHLLVGGTEVDRLFGLAINLGIAGTLAAFGFFARRGSDFAFILGMFLYFADGVVVLGYRDIFGFSVHVLALFFLFKGLLASRRRYDPSVD